MALDVKLSLQQMMVLRVQQMGAYFSSQLVYCTCYPIACKILSIHIIIFDDCPQLSLVETHFGNSLRLLMVF